MKNNRSPPKSPKVQSPTSIKPYQQIVKTTESSQLPQHTLATCSSRARSISQKMELHNLKQSPKTSAFQDSNPKPQNRQATSSQKSMQNKQEKGNNQAGQSTKSSKKSQIKPETVVQKILQENQMLKDEISLLRSLIYQAIPGVLSTNKVIQNQRNEEQVNQFSSGEGQSWQEEEQENDEGNTLSLGQKIQMFKSIKNPEEAEVLSQSLVQLRQACGTGCFNNINESGPFSLGGDDIDDIEISTFDERKTNVYMHRMMDSRASNQTFGFQNHSCDMSLQQENSCSQTSHQMVKPIYSTAKLGKINELNKVSKNFNMPLAITLPNKTKVLMTQQNMDVTKIKAIIDKISSTTIYQEFKSRQSSKHSSPKQQSSHKASQHSSSRLELKQVQKKQGRGNPTALSKPIPELKEYFTGSSLSNGGHFSSDEEERVPLDSAKVMPSQNQQILKQNNKGKMSKQASPFIKFQAQDNSEKSGKKVQVLSQTHSPSPLPGPASQCNRFSNKLEMIHPKSIIRDEDTCTNIDCFTSISSEESNTTEKPDPADCLEQMRETTVQQMQTEQLNFYDRQQTEQDLRAHCKTTSMKERQFAHQIREVNFDKQQDVDLPGSLVDDDNIVDFYFCQQTKEGIFFSLGSDTIAGGKRESTDPLISIFKSDSPIRKIEKSRAGTGAQTERQGRGTNHYRYQEYELSSGTTSKHSFSGNASLKNSAKKDVIVSKQARKTNQECANETIQEILRETCNSQERHRGAPEKDSLIYEDSIPQLQVLVVQQSEMPQLELSKSVKHFEEQTTILRSPREKKDNNQESRLSLSPTQQSIVCNVSSSSINGKRNKSSGSLGACSRKMFKDFVTKQLREEKHKDAIFTKWVSQEDKEKRLALINEEVLTHRMEEEEARQLQMVEKPGAQWALSAQVQSKVQVMSQQTVEDTTFQINSSNQSSNAQQSSTALGGSCNELTSTTYQHQLSKKNSEAQLVKGQIQYQAATQHKGIIPYEKAKKDPISGAKMNNQINRVLSQERAPTTGNDDSEQYLKEVESNSIQVGTSPLLTLNNSSSCGGFNNQSRFSSLAESLRQSKIQPVQAQVVQEVGKPQRDSAVQTSITDFKRCELENISTPTPRTLNEHVTILDIPPPSQYQLEKTNDSRLQTIEEVQASVENYNSPQTSIYEMKRQTIGSTEAVIELKKSNLDILLSEFLNEEAYGADTRAGCADHMRSKVHSKYSSVGSQQVYKQTSPDCKLLSPEISSATEDMIVVSASTNKLINNGDILSKYSSCSRVEDYNSQHRLSEPVGHLRSDTSCGSQATKQIGVYEEGNGFSGETVVLDIRISPRKVYCQRLTPLPEEQSSQLGEDNSASESSKPNKQLNQPSMSSKTQTQSDSQRQVALERGSKQPQLQASMSAEGCSHFVSLTNIDIQDSEIYQSGNSKLLQSNFKRDGYSSQTTGQQHQQMLASAYNSAQSGKYRTPVKCNETSVIAPTAPSNCTPRMTQEGYNSQTMMMDYTLTCMPDPELLESKLQFQKTLQGTQFKNQTMVATSSPGDHSHSNISPHQARSMTSKISLLNTQRYSEQLNPSSLKSSCTTALSALSKKTKSPEGGHQSKDQDLRNKLSQLQERLDKKLDKINKKKAKASQNSTLHVTVLSNGGNPLRASQYGEDNEDCTPASPTHPCSGKTSNQPPAQRAQLPSNHRPRIQSYNCQNREQILVSHQQNSAGGTSNIHSQKKNKQFESRQQDLEAKLKEKEERIQKILDKKKHIEEERNLKRQKQHQQNLSPSQTRQSAIFATTCDNQQHVTPSSPTHGNILNAKATAIKNSITPDKKGEEADQILGIKIIRQHQVTQQRNMSAAIAVGQQHMQQCIPIKGKGISVERKDRTPVKQNPLQLKDGKLQKVQLILKGINNSNCGFSTQDHRQGNSNNALLTMGPLSERSQPVSCALNSMSPALTSLQPPTQRQVEFYHRIATTTVDESLLDTKPGFIKRKSSAVQSTNTTQASGYTHQSRLSQKVTENRLNTTGGRLTK